MATFAPEVQEQNPQNFLGYSQGPGVPKFGELFAGLGDAIGGTAKAIDLGNQTDIKKDARAAVEGVQSLFGLPEATAVAAANPDPAKPIPPALQQESDRLAVLKKGMEQGTIKASHYYGLLNAKTRELRSKYPGYEDFIDNTIQSIAGVDPANATISALRQEANESASKADADARQWQSFENTNAGYIQMAFPDYFVNPSKYSQAEVQQKVGSLKAMQLNNDLVKDQMSIEMTQGTLDDRKVSHNANSMASGIGRQFVEGTLNALSPDSSYQSLTTTLQNWQKTGMSPSPEEANQLRANITQARLKITEEVNKQLMQEPYASRMSKQDKDNAVAAALAPLDTMWDAYNNKDYGALQMTGAWVKASQDQTQAQLLRDVPLFGKLNAVKGTVGDAAMGIILSQNKAVSDAMSSVLLGDLLLNNALTGPTVIDGKEYTPSGDINDDLKKVTEWSKNPSIDVSSKAPSFYLDSTIKMATSKDQTLSSNAMKKLFANNGGLNLSYVDETNYRQTGSGSPRDRAFAKLTSPEITQAVKGMPPEIQTSYLNWARRNFQSRLELTARDMQRRMDAFPELKDVVEIFYDPDQGRLVYKDKPSPGIDNPDMIANAKDILLNDMRDLNVAIPGMKPIFEAFGKDPNREMEGSLQLIGVPLLQDGENKPGDADGIFELDPIIRRQIDSLGTERATDFLASRIVGHGREDVTGMQPEFRGRLAAMFASAPDDIKKGLGIYSGFRSPERQAMIIARNAGKYGLDKNAWLADVEELGPIAAGQKWASRFKSSGMSRSIGKPGGSYHQHGNAADLSYNGVSLSQAPSNVVRWVHENAARYGLKFPRELSHEVWHIEMQETRNGPAYEKAFAEGDYGPEDVEDFAFTEEPDQ